MNWNKENIILIFGIALVGSFIFSFMQGWLGIQIWYFLIILGIITMLVAVSHTKAKKTLGIDKAYDTALPILQKFKLATESGAPLRKFYRVPDNKRFSGSGKVWELEFKGNPGSHIVLIDAKTGKVVGGEFYGSEIESPMKKEWGEPVYPRYYKPRKYKKKVEEEIKPG